MTLDNVELFHGISDESIDAMIHCFKPECRKFKKGDTEDAGDMNTIKTDKGWKILLCVIGRCGRSDPSEGLCNQ